jgi:outer membrane receptor protein involved in Fe transport
LVAAVLLTMLAAIAAGDDLEGLTLAEALNRLQREGLTVIFSDALVTPTMRVTATPTATTPREVLVELLAPHGLGVRDGPAGQLFVVALPAAEPARPPTEAAAAIRFSPDLLFLSEIVVTPSHFRIEELQPESRLFVSREDVKQVPHIGDDLYRAVKRLPGAASGDFSATFNVRGGEQEEMLVILDGLELIEPFHLKDFQNVFSTVDTETVGGMDFLTGGFPVEYGDRMSAVMDISTVTPEGPAATSVTLGTLNARLTSEGRFNGRRGSWLVNGRAWYPAPVFGATFGTADEVLADYYDVVAMIEHEIGAHSTLAGNLLTAADDLGYTTADADEIETVSARYRSTQLWLNLKTSWTPSLWSQTVASAARSERRRTGGYVDLIEGTLDIDDERELEVLAFKQDWTLTLGDRHFLKWGVDLRRQRALYDYSRVEVVLDPENPEEPPELVQTIVDLEPSGSSDSAYIADRFRLGDRVVAELGVRWDRQSYVGHHQLSPRANLLWTASPRTTLRAAWGRFHQSQRLNELQVADGVTEYYPAQRADHLLVSLEHRFERGPALRLEVYDKRLDDLRPRYENVFNPLELFPEATFDRVRIAPDLGRARGLEALVRGDPEAHLSWWASYVLARADDEIDGAEVPRGWDQRHALALGLGWRLPKGWALNLAATWHSGWPTTPVTAEWVVDDEGEESPELVFGPRNSARYPDYQRLDVRASKSFVLSRGELRLVLEVLNLTNRENVCCIEDFVIIENDDGSLTVDPEERFWAPIVPSIAVTWTF